tara:strand:+ start:241 stop:471 length:231 start_codon:yes stop_codon:yes gene_type:complete
MDNTEKIATFKRLAKENYDRSMGWSVFTECYDDASIVLFVDDVETPAEVERLMAEVASVNDDRYGNAEIEGGFFAF